MLSFPTSKLYNESREVLCNLLTWCDNDDDVDSLTSSEIIHFACCFTKVSHSYSFWASSRQALVIDICSNYLSKCVDVQWVDCDASCIMQLQRNCNFSFYYGWKFMQAGVNFLERQFVNCWLIKRIKQALEAYQKLYRLWLVLETSLSSKKPLIMN